MADADWTGGLASNYDYMLAEKPDDPAMRESASIWLYEDNGEFGFPRIGIEGIGAAWENHRYDCNFAFKDGRALIDVRQDAKSHSPIGPDGRPSILGSGGLMFQCIEPFRKWRVTYDGQPMDTTSADIIARKADPSRRTDLRFEVDITMVTPAWVQDNTPEKLAKMTEAERTDAGLMGYGYRMEHLFRGEGTLTIDGQTRPFKASGLRIHRQSVRPLEAFRGHCWQSAVFPDGRAFGYVAYPPVDGEEDTYNDGYLYQGGKWYPARARNIPFMRALVAGGDDVSVELESELGITRIGGVSAFNTFKLDIPELPGFALQQGGARYSWDGQTAFGMLERSTWESQIKT